LGKIRNLAHNPSHHGPARSGAARNYHDEAAAPAQACSRPASAEGIHWQLWNSPRLLLALSSESDPQLESLTGIRVVGSQLGLHWQELPAGPGVRRTLMESSKHIRSLHHTIDYFYQKSLEYLAYDFNHLDCLYYFQNGALLDTLHNFETSY
jgi:hypothetical protein